MKYLFIDTNILIHFRHFEEIPWMELVGDQFELLVAPITISELDKHKRNHKRKIADRAKKVLRRIEDIDAEPTSYSLSFTKNRPPNDIFERLQLDRQEQDDLLLATIIDYKVQNPSHEIYLASDDTGIILKARSLGINIFRVPEDYIMPNEKSEEEVEIEKLIKENRQLKNALPKLKLTFAEEQQVLTYEIMDLSETLDEYIERCSKEELSQFQSLIYQNPENRGKDIQQKKGEKDISLSEQLKAIQTFGNVFNVLRKEQVDSYNSKLSEFHVEYRKYLKKRYLFEKVACLSVPIRLFLHNVGTFPADDIDIWLHFPDGFVLKDLDKMPGEPSKPPPPYKPKNQFDFGPGLNLIPNIHHFFNPQIPDINMGYGGLQIRETNSYEVDYSIKSLKHHQVFPIDPLLAIFHSVDKAKGFTIDYKLIVGNMPQPVEGKLNVKLSEPPIKDC